MEDAHILGKSARQRLASGLVLLLALGLAGCAGTLNGPEPTASSKPAQLPSLRAPATATEPTQWRTHTVKAGETLRLIAERHGTNAADLARWNGISNLNLIHPGQRLKVPFGAIQPALQGSETAASGIAWRWPVNGPLLALFEGEGGNKGIDIGGAVGTKIRAVSGGRVAYAGSGLKGYGELMIIKHNNNYLSAYAYNRTLYVKEGDTVQAGQEIAEMGTGPDRRPSLHFEIRYNGQPVDPLRYLPAR